MTVITIHQRAECKSKKVSALDQYERIATYRAPARAKFEDQGRKTGAGGKSGFDLIKELPEDILGSSTGWDKFYNVDQISCQFVRG